MINRLIDFYRLVPGAGRVVGWIVIIIMVLAICSSQFGISPTIVLALAFLAIYGGAWYYRRMVERKMRQQGLAFGKAVGGALGPSKEEFQKQVSDLNQRWQEALATFKYHKVNLYDLPWYMLIGEPQSGKSTTLQSSDLNFPLGKVAFSGTGGTKNCDWWFTDKGVVLDTAGRFTIQDETATDSHEWDRFLELLVKHRPYCPINGVILVIPADALLQQDRGTIENNAKMISQRLIDIQQKLAICFPVYVMVSKCDLIYGFTQFFDQLPPSQQLEMFGWGQEELTQESFDTYAFNKAFDGILTRIRHTRLKSLSKSHAVSPDKTFVFPEEFNSLRDPLACYLKAIFEGNAFRQPLQFRGFYFSSATQEGKPIIKACGSMIPNGEILQDLREIFPNKRAFFVKDFYSEKVFPEEGLVTRGPKFQKEDKRKAQTLYGVNAALVVFGLVFVFFMWNGLNNRLHKPKMAIEQAKTVLDMAGKNVDFFDQNYRTDIFGAMDELENAVASTHAPGFNFFKGTRNALTEDMDNVLAILYLDRFLMGMFQRADRQLRNFELDQTTGNSNHDLKMLCEALANLQAWRDQVERFSREKSKADLDSFPNPNQPGAFKPNIEPFIALVHRQEWENQLLKERGQDTVRQKLNYWFEVIYNHASPEMRQILIDSMVKLTHRTDFYKNLHLQVLRFYKRQTELINFVGTDNLLRIWSRIEETPSSTAQYEEALFALEEFFASHKTYTIEEARTNYLTFDEIRNLVIDTLGSNYEDFEANSAQNKEITSISNIEQGDLEKESVLDPEVVNFVVNLHQMSDHREDTSGKTHKNGDNAISHSFIKTFLNKVVLPYNALPKHESYIGNDFESPSRGIGELLNSSANKIEKSDELWLVVVDEVIYEMPANSNTKKLKDATKAYHQLIREQEKDLVLKEVTRIIRRTNTGVPIPPNDWDSYVARLNRLADDNFEEVISLPRDVVILLDNNGDHLNLIFDNDSPLKDFISYGIDVKRVMTALYLAVTSFNGTTTEANRLLELTSIKSVPDAMSQHAIAIRKWGEMAGSLIAIRATSVEMCSRCEDDYRGLVAAIQRIGKGFPHHYNGQSNQIKTGLSRVEATADLATMMSLKTFFRTIEPYRELDEEQEEYLRKMGKLEFIRQAVEWGTAIEKLLNNELTMEYSIEYIEDSSEAAHDRNVQEVFTFATMEGSYEARRISLNSPRFEKITKAHSSEDFTVIRFHEKTANDGDGQETQIIIRQGLMGFLAWALDGSIPKYQENVRMKIFRLPLQNNQEVKGLLLFKTSAPIPNPPNWERLKEM